MYVGITLLIQIRASDSTHLFATGLFRMANNGHIHQAT